MKKILTTPFEDREIESLRVGDIIYMNGELTTCRDVAHRRLIELGRKLPIDLERKAILHAGPIVEEKKNGWRMVSVGPTTSMRMERFEREFIAKTGVKLIIGKGGMGPETAEGCRAHKAVHAVFPGGCAVLAATRVERIERVYWQELGMPESLWVCKVEEFGPLIVSIDAAGNNLFAQHKEMFNARKDALVKEISKKVRYIK